MQRQADSGVKKWGGRRGGGALALGRRWREADAAGFALATGEKS